ncbi:MAG: hypothetical protein KGH65_05180 [Candidatus Micrarchaeota archaeon]|nr:hypothetical protein [Candidatus Micrarchaeota archaeon]
MPTEDELNEALNNEDGNIPEPEEEPVAAESQEAEESQEEPQEGEEPEPQTRRTDRASRRIQSLSEAKARAEAEAQLQRELAERYRREAEQARQPREDEFIDPSERRMRDTEMMARNAHMAALDAADRATFISQASIDPNRAKYKDRVELELQRARNQGQMASREGIYVYLRGQDAIAAEAKSAGARKKSAEVIREQRGKPNSPRSDASPNRAKSLEDRLKDVQI